MGMRMFKGFKTKDVNTAKQSAKYNPFVKFFFCHRYNIPDSAYFEIATAVYKSKQTGLPQTVKIGERSVVIENGALSSKTKITEQSEIARKAKSFAGTGLAAGALFGTFTSVAELNLAYDTFSKSTSSAAEALYKAIVATFGYLIVSTAAGAGLGAVAGAASYGVKKLRALIRHAREKRRGISEFCRATMDIAASPEQKTEILEAKLKGEGSFGGKMRLCAKIGAAIGATLGTASIIMTAWTFYELASAFSKNVIISVAPSMVAGLVVISTAAGAAVGAAVGAGVAAISNIAKTIRKQNEPFQHTDEDWYLF